MKQLKFGDRVTWKRKDETVHAIVLYENAAGIMVESEKLQGYANRKELRIGWRKKI